MSIWQENTISVHAHDLLCSLGLKLLQGLEVDLDPSKDLVLRSVLHELEAGAEGVAVVLESATENFF